ncbi:MAG TPA: hypothetical protein VGY56_10700 [Verrucomicrobiae bacterium]|nr:hypothetical protein [Verrucomicrobiae bacterium]
MSVEWKQEIKLSEDLRRMVVACGDKTGLGAAIAREMDKQNEFTVTAIRGKLAGTLLRRRTGHLANSIEQTDALVVTDAQGGEVRSSVGSGVRYGKPLPYAAPLEFGSKPHLIRAKNAPVLRFIGKDGNWVSKKEVHHPGNKEYSYIRGTVEERLALYSKGVGGAAFTFLTGGDN